MRYYGGDNDFDTTTKKALSEIDKNWEKLPGVIIFGTHAASSIEPKLELIQEAREKKIPCYGECFGMQLMAIEFARNVLGLKDASSTEIRKMCADPVIHKNPDGLRVGIYPADGRMESFWHNYSLNPYYWDQFTQQNWNLGIQDKIVVSMSYQRHPFFEGTQYHASYQSSKEKPHPVLKRFIEQCKTQ